MLALLLTATSTRLAWRWMVPMACVAWIGIAEAEPSAPDVSASLEVAASADCTTRAELVARVHARSPRVKFVDAASGVAIRARFSLTASGAVAGDLTLASRGARQTTRRVLAGTCGEAADAAALIIAVTLDPTARPPAGQQSGAATEKVTPGSAGTASPTGPSTKNTSGTEKSPVPAKQQPFSTPADPPTADEPPTAAGASGRPAFGVVLAAQSFVGPAPRLMGGVALYGLAGVDRSPLWSPAVVLGATYALRTGLEEQGGTASFTLLAASVDACPFRLRWGAFEARPCASGLGGRLTARATDTQNPAGESARPFWVLGGAVIATVHLPWLLEASARFGAGANLVQDSFVFTPRVFHMVPPITVAASLGIGVRWH
jgi:hypothetical protein